MAKSTVVTFVIQNAAGQLMMQVRNYVNAEGNSPGQLSLFGAHHPGGAVDVPAIVSQELGINVTAADVQFVGHVLDDNVAGRVNLVHKINVAYDSALVDQNPAGKDLMEKIATAQGMGVVAVGKDDLKAALEAGNVSAISAQILKEHRGLKPRA
ncbi:MAG: hypothetical protein VX730_08400 [Pseudomonadota bacterium]|nr:hypothetical protein [Pseudomonadota bacterium]MEC9292407.1 hypothetical protein [Pseudomonadota bacterium]